MFIHIVFYLSVIWTVQGDCELKFPDDFKIGIGSSAYQIEGGWNEGGKGESIWDRFVHDHPDKITDKANGDIACDSYHKLDDDIENLKWLGVDFYRFSLSWSRILPTGYANIINPDGVRYYNELIDKLIANNITPMVTLYHWDLPQPLQEIGGFPNILLADFYEDYARVVFKLFGDRVKLWITFNEPTEFCQLGYAYGKLAPGYNSVSIGDYLCGRTLLLAHARAYRMYKKEFFEDQKGQVGMTVTGNWQEPATDSPEDKEAAERAIWMNIGWWTHPILSKTGDYPPIMIQRIDQLSKEEGYPRSRLIPFTAEEVDLIKGTYDFLGLNHYITRLTSANTSSFTWDNPGQNKDVGVNNFYDPSWPGSTAEWLKTTPFGLRKSLKWINDQYDNPLVYVLENGCPDLPGVHDNDKIEYLREYLKSLLEAIHYDKCNVRAFGVWTLMDNFEWYRGYTLQFGLFYVNFTSPDRPRIPRDSARFYKQFIQHRSLDTSLYPKVQNLTPDTSIGICWFPSLYLLLLQTYIFFFIY